ncbi:MAG: PSD1 and planctomycete cytochrome C domain-containing protein [Planctomycetota bacterium]|nr:PSD1 and planctomycete cytochrome C domain-containing protein [Planctomycetota bacterium]
MIRRLIIPLIFFAASELRADNKPLFEDQVQTIFAAKCTACHGANRVKRKAELDLRSIGSILRGGESGPVIADGKLDESALWEKIASGEMPPEGSEPLTDNEKLDIKNWLEGGAKSRAPRKAVADLTDAERNFWSYRELKRSDLPTVKNSEADITPLDRFVLAKLEQQGLSFASPADRRTLIRRVTLDLTGLPPTREEIENFVNDSSPKAYEKLVDRLIASPHYGERWGRLWLDVVGFSESNGYIRHDSPRPLAWRYRDYVIDSFNNDKPYDQIWVEQLAGDELVNYPAKESLTPDDLEKLTATHFLRNAPDGTDNTEGNEITRVMERYAVLEAHLQITMSAMFGVTIDCARCHSHKFDPIPQQDYYSLQAIFYPAFNVKEWTQPKDRWIYAVGQHDVAAWKASNESADKQIAEVKESYQTWLNENRPKGAIAFHDNFSSTDGMSNWSVTAPGDDTPAGKPPLTFDGESAPMARLADGKLSLVAAGSSQSTWLVTQQSFDWTPDEIGGWIQATFDLADGQGPDGNTAERIGYYIALHDFDDSADILPGDNNFDVPKGNILFDGNPGGGAGVYLDYPGGDQQGVGAIGTAAYQSGHNYGVRVTRTGDDEFLLQHIADGVLEEKSITVPAIRLPDGGFGFELCCSRSFTVDNIVIESSHNDEEIEDQKGEYQRFAAAEQSRMPEPDKLAWVTDLTQSPPPVPLLTRGDYFQHGENVEPAALSMLTDDDNHMQVDVPESGAPTTGRRLAFARWATHPDSRPSALLARVHVDRLWRGHFGIGLVPTPDNFGISGLPPDNLELLEWLAAEFVAAGWKQKVLHRSILLSRTYRQASFVDDGADDPRDAEYHRFPAHRLDAESIRDSMLAVAGVLNEKMGGPSIEFVDNGSRKIILPAPSAESDELSEVDRRSIYIRHRRTQPMSFMEAFDLAVPEPNCLARSTTTVVSQSLSLINGDFAVRMGEQFADRLMHEAGETADDQIGLAFELAFGREPTPIERERSRQFLETQTELRKTTSPDNAAKQSLSDFCRMLLASNEFLYVP